MLLALVAASHAACSAGTTVADLTAAVGAAEAAYVAMDLEAFHAARERADAAIPCLTEVLTPPDAAAWHRLAGLDAFVVQDSHRTLSAFRAAVAIQPAFNLPSTIAPEGNPLAAIYGTARNQPPGPLAELPVPGSALAYVDGTRADERATARQTLVQLAASSGEVLWSGVLLADAPAPDWSAFGSATGTRVGAEGEALPTTAPTAAKRRKPTLPLAIAAGGAAVAAGVLYGMAADKRADFDDPETALADVESLAAATNTLQWSSLGASAVAVGLGGFAVVTVAW